jgi:hypothetical protein
MILSCPFWKSPRTHYGDGFHKISETRLQHQVVFAPISSIKHHGLEVPNASTRASSLIRNSPGAFTCLLLFEISAKKDIKVRRMFCSAGSIFKFGLRQHKIHCVLELVGYKSLTRLISDAASRQCQRTLSNVDKADSCPLWPFPTTLRKLRVCLFLYMIPQDCQVYSMCLSFWKLSSSYESREIH